MRSPVLHTSLGLSDWLRKPVFWISEQVSWMDGRPLVRSERWSRWWESIRKVMCFQFQSTNGADLASRASCFGDVTMACDIWTTYKSCSRLSSGCRLEPMTLLAYLIYIWVNRNCAAVLQLIEDKYRAEIRERSEKLWANDNFGINESGKGKSHNRLISIIVFPHGLYL